MAIPRRSPFLRLLFVSLSFAVAVLVGSTAHAQIKQPGAHPDYSVELEPHLVYQWADTYWGNDGLGLGARVSIPVVKNGPVTTINNNFAIGFGLDWAHADGCYGWYGNGYVYNAAGNRVYVGGPGVGCSQDHFFLPVAAQWNFFFTPVVSAFAEMGFALQHVIPNCDDALANVYVNGAYCHNFTRLQFLFAVGPRFHVADSFAITLRIGIPYLSIGGSFLL